ncbi:swi5-like zinc finger protein [Coemansia sp. RSA 1933]|nr:swi5-like zinc finger protein [Coemansia sp. RSA 1933]
MDSSPSKRSSNAKRTVKETPPLPPPPLLDDDLTTNPVSGGNPAASTDSKTPLPEDPSPEDERNKGLEAAISSLRRELDELKQRRDVLLSDEAMTLEKAHAMNEEHIDRLHRYNDIKDAGQILFGKLAELKGKTVKEVYEDYGVNLKD